MAKIGKPFKHGNRWKFSYMDADGKRQWGSEIEQKDAKASLHRLQAEAEAVRTGLTPRPPQPHTFGELADYWLKHRTPEKRSQKDDRSIIDGHLRPHFGALMVTEVAVTHVDRYRRLHSKLAPKTIHNHLTMLISMLNLAVDLGWLVTPPRIKKPKLLEQEYGWLRTLDEQRALLGAASVEVPGVMELYATALYTGMRAGELLGLRWTDVDFERRLITVSRSYDKPTKTGAVRHVPILDPLLPLLRAWRLRSGTDLCFTNRNGNAYGPSSRVLQEVLQRCLVRAELTGKAGRPYEEIGITFHDLRHTFASQWAMAGGDPYKLQKILGHKSFQMTQRYAHLAPEAFSGQWGLLKNAVPHTADASVPSMIGSTAEKKASA